MLKAFIITLLAISGMRQACAEGCLKCSTSGDCLVADISRNYYLNGTTATRVTLDNCELISHDGKCAVCKEKYYIDGTTGKCVAVATAALISNCSRYSTGTNCSVCATDYYVTENACVAVETKISNCRFYSGASTCSSCNDNFFLSLDAKSCVAAPTTANCNDYSFVKCNTCAAGFVLNPNNYLSSQLTSTTAGEKGALAFFAYYGAGGRRQQTSQSACQVESTTNCSVFNQSVNTCTACLFGWYLDEKAACIVYPDEPIENCLHYNSATTCGQCNAGYYFSSNVCTQITGTALISNCATYNGTTNSVVCSTCSANYYLNNNSCTLRVNSADNLIANCSTKSNTQDRCATCASGYFLTNDGLECKAVVTNCATHTSIASGQEIRCNKCNDTFYLKTNAAAPLTECLAGTVANCREYSENSATSCTICLNGFILQNSACVAHNEIASCTEYSSSNIHTCNTCTNATNFNFSLVRTCQNIPQASLVTNCATYSGNLDAIVCASCNTGYYLSSGSCILIETANCLIKDGTECTNCAASYARSFNSLACIKSFGYMTDQCAEDSTIDSSNTELANEVTCNHCKEHAIPYDVNNHFVCMNNAEILDVAESTDATIIKSGCTKYNEDIKCIQCDVASSTPYLDTSVDPPVCVNVCPNVVFYKYRLDADGQLDQFNVCHANADHGGAVGDANCAIYAPNTNAANSNYICVKCKDSMVTVVDPVEDTYSNVAFNSNNLSDFFPSPHFKTPGVTCEATSVSTKIANVVTQTLTSNCAYFYEIAADEYACLRCNYGFTGTINTDNFISSCDRDSACETNNLYNLDTSINNLVSCHKCVSTTSIPFIAFVGNDNAGDIEPVFDGFARYGIVINGVVFTDATATQKNVACRVNAATTFGIASASYKIPANCGIGVLLVNTDGTNNETDTYGNYCAACKPGFSATDDANFDNVKTACTAIANCAANSTFFNACSDCATGYIHKYDIAGDGNIPYDTCLSVPSSLTAKLANCYAADVNTGTTAGGCKACKRGFSLNKDGFCEGYKPYQCETGSFRFSESVHDDHKNWKLYLQGTGVGCHKCSSTFSAVKIDGARDVCFSSTWVNTSVDAIVIADTDYIPRCKHYNATSGTLTCKVCDTNYVIKGSGPNTITGDECFINTSITNCEIASTATVCQKCISEAYSLKSNKCEAGNIANCVAYNFNVNDTVVKCTRCAADYYLSTNDNTCKLGRIHNCKVLFDNNEKGCSECQDGFTKISNIKDSYDYCYPNDSSFNCSATVLTSGSLGGNYECTTCTNSGSQLPGSIAAASNQTACINFAPIANCSTYDIGSTLNTSNFKCTACNTGFYLDYERCVARVNQPSKCSSYSATSDTCDACDSTSYLADAGKKCTDYPKGILGCRIYSNATTCTSCKIGRYLSTNACPAVTTPITNCAYYSANNVCSQCDSTYVLVNNTCVKATAANCATYTSETVCATCPAGFGLETTSNVTNCVSKSKTGCAVIDINTPYNCLQCSGTYYLDAGECKTPTTITNCATYDSSTTCSLCSKGYALSADKTACTNASLTAGYIDGNCADSQIVGSPVCSRCQAGFFFVNGACTGSCNSSSLRGCLACNPNTPEECYICSTGFYQTRDGKCNAIAVPDSNVLIMGVMSAIVALIALMF